MSFDVTLRRPWFTDSPTVMALPSLDAYQERARSLSGFGATQVV